MDSFCNLCFVFVIFLVCSLQPCGHLLGKTGLLALLCVHFFVFLSLSFIVSWVRFGT